MKTGIFLLWGSYVVSLLGVLFKMQHWLGANILLLTGFTCMAAASVWVWKQQKSTLPSWFNLAASAVLLFLVVAALFSVLHWPGHETLRTVGYVLCMIFPALLLLPRHLSLSKEYWMVYASWVLVVMMLSTVHSIAV